MATTKQFILLFGSFLLSLAVFSQDRINLLSGSYIDCKVEEVSDSLITYTYTKKSGKEKTKFMEAYRAFSVVYAGGEEKVIYKQDTLIGNYFSSQEMRLFVYGAQDANAYYKANKWFYAGLVAGAAGGYASQGGFFALGIPISFGLIAYAPRIKIKPEMVRNTDLLQEPAYVMGFERVARYKRFRAALLGSIPGTIVGLGSYYIVQNNN